MKEAINKGMLAPFHYYGGYDGTDYSGLRLTRGKYEEQELTELYMQNAARYDLIYKYYMKYRSQRALGFCCSRQHAKIMAEDLILLYRAWQMEKESYLFQKRRQYSKWFI